MRPNAYRTLSQNEEHGWYYEARRRAIARLIERYVLDDHAAPRDAAQMDALAQMVQHITEIMTFPI